MHAFGFMYLAMLGKRNVKHIPNVSDFPFSMTLYVRGS